MTRIAAMASPTADDDDLPPGLPPPDGDDAATDESSFDEKDDGAPESESVGLDAEVGLSDGDEALDDFDESGSWLDDEKGIADEADSDEFVEAEYGWTSDVDPSGWQDDGGDDDAADEMPAQVDRGEEGFVENPSEISGDDDVIERGIIERSMNVDEDSADIDLREDAEIEGVRATFEDEQRWAGAEMLERVRAGVIVAAVVAPGDERFGAMALDSQARGAWLAGTALWRWNGPTLERVSSTGLEEHEVTSIGALDATTLVVGTRLGGVFVSGDSGVRFAATNGWHRSHDGALTAASTVIVDSQTRRVWLMHGGGLYRTEDAAQSWAGPLLMAPARAMTRDTSNGSLRVVLSSQRSKDAQLATTDDGGRSWANRQIRDVIAPGSGRGVIVACDGLRIAVAEEGAVQGPVVATDADAKFERLARLPRPTAFAWHDGVFYAALFFAGANRSVIVRRTEAGVVERIAEIPTDLDVPATAERDAHETGLRVQSLIVTARAEGGVVIRALLERMAVAIEVLPNSP